MYVIDILGASSLQKAKMPTATLGFPLMSIPPVFEGQLALLHSRLASAQGLHLQNWIQPWRTEKAALVPSSTCTPGSHQEPVYFSWGLLSRLLSLLGEGGAPSPPSQAVFYRLKLHSHLIGEEQRHRGLEREGKTLSGERSCRPSQLRLPVASCGPSRALPG